MNSTPNPDMFRGAPGSGSERTVVKYGESEGQPVRFFLYSDVLQELRYAATFWGERSGAAFLIGVFGADEDGPFVEVRGFDGLEPIDSEDDLYECIRTGTDYWIASGEALKNPIVGVFFSKPDSQSALTEEMARVHLSLFNIPFQLALVVDPVIDTVAAYARAPRGAFANCAFHLVTPRTSGAVVADESSVAVDSPDVESNTELKTDA